MPTVPTIETRDRVIAAIPDERRGIFLATRLALRPQEARALDTDQYDRAKRILRVERAMRGLNHTAPRRLTKEKNWRAVEVDQKLGDRVPRGSRCALFQHPGGRSNERRWSHPALTKEWKLACRRAGFAHVSL